MVMKQNILLLITFLSLNFTISQTFTANGLVYNITSATTVELGDNSAFTGDAIIPATVSYSSTTYNVTAIGYEAFNNCTGLTSVIIPDSVTSLVASAFYSCPGLTSVTIPDSVTTIGNQALYNCPGLTSVSIGNSVTSIGLYAFAYSGITSITIPGTVNSIKSSAFANCSGLTNVRADVVDPASITLGTIVYGGSTPVTTATLTVPPGSTSAYAAAAQWTDFGTILPNSIEFSNNSWSPMAPTGATSQINATITDGTYTVSTDISLYNVTVNPEANIVIDPATTATLNSLNLESTSTNFSSLILNGSLTGTVNYKRYTSLVGPTGTNDLISAPVSGQEFGAFASANPNLAASDNIRAFAPFDNTITTAPNTTGAYVNYIVGTDDAVTLDPGIGYRAATTDGSPLTFTGIVNTSTVNRPIAIGSGSQWNLIGNPYPSYLKVQDFLNHQVSIDPEPVITNIDLLADVTKAIYGYDGDASDGWTIYNLSNTTESTLIAPGQGFFVAADGVDELTYDIQFSPDMRDVGTSDDFIPLRAVNENNVLSKIQLYNTTDTYQTDIYFIDGTTRGLDPGYDAGAFQGNAAGIFTNLVEDNTGVEFAIQTLPYNDLNDVVVPFGVKADQGTQLTISLGADSTIPGDNFMYLEDNVTNIWTLLNTNDYVFTPSVDLNGTGRFFVHFTSSSLAVDENTLNGLQIYVPYASRTLLIKGQLTTNSMAIIYDLQGRKVLETELNSETTTNSIDVNSLGSGIYIVELKNNYQNKTQKVIIK